MKDPIRVTSYTRIWRSLRRALKPNEWAVWLLGLPRSRNSAIERGLILVQIDGLSRNQLDRALKSGKMPFLEKLLSKEQYQNHVLYSGLPASTPSVQGELYYGERTVVPAFGFRDHRTGRLVRMFANEIAKDVEEEMKLKSEGLLKGGSSYSNIYGGGAKDVHFCATDFGWGEFFNTINPFTLLVVMVLNFWMFFRVAALAIGEFFLSVWDFFRGLISGRQFWQELVMIPARVVVVVLLRELVTTGACFDAARGLPIIHLNLLGYDEQAHRRGPQSRFAHGSLRAIDSSIRRLWKAAHQGAGREYDVWVFSDHGQETTRPYQLEHGFMVQKAVVDVVAECVPEPDVETNATPPNQDPSRIPTRANWIGIGWLVSLMFGEQDHDIQTRSSLVQTVTSGPLGFVYLLSDSSKPMTATIASRLVAEFNVPMISFVDDEQGVRVVTLEGQYQLPADAIQVFGADHPFLGDVTDDLIRLTRHPDAGQMVLIGWNHKNESTSFVLQNGAHAGPGTEETQAFALLPPDAPIVFRDQCRYLRPNDLRLAALRFLGRTENPESTVQVPALQVPIRLMTYNVHACVGMDGQLSPERIARVIAQSGANVVCLQELDVFRQRSGHIDQARAIAHYLKMHHAFHPAWNVDEERFGNAVLSQFPMKIIEAKGLHHYKADRSRRSAIWAQISVAPNCCLQVLNTHMSIFPKEQIIQTTELIEEWIAPASQFGPVVLCGDFNSRPHSKVHQMLHGALADVETDVEGTPRATYFSPYPVARFDHIFHSVELAAKRVQVIETRLAQIASDHLPLVADLKFDQPTSPFALRK